MDAKCPWCGGELEEGRYYNMTAGAHFLPAGRKKPALLTRSSIEAKCGIATPPFVGLLGDGPSSMRAWACRQCKKLILAYEEE